MLPSGLRTLDFGVFAFLPFSLGPAGTCLVFGLWRVRFPPVLVRTGRRLPVQALGERRVWVAVTGYPRGGAPGP